jgi:nucleotide-binding universal stress UspA family protein
VPTDFSQSAERALALAANLVVDDGELELLHCINIPSEIAGHWVEANSVPKQDWISIYDSLTAAGRKRAGALIDEHAHARARFRSIIIKEVPKEGIRSRLADGDYDLVVMGSRGRTGAKRWLLGSVAEATVSHAPCSVLVVRDKGWSS